MRVRMRAGLTVTGGLIALLTVALAGQQASPAADANKPWFGSLQWRSIGIVRGGRSIATTGVKGRPLEAYFGAVGGGLWKTIDGGQTWNPVTDGQIGSSSVGAVAVSESNPNIVYIGMGETCIRGNIMQGDGLYKSTDAGKTWTHLAALRDSQAISKIRIHPTNPDIVFAAVFGHPSAPSDERGVYRTKDGGKTWQRVLFRDPKTAAIDVSIDHQHPNVVYAAMWEAYRTSWQMSSGGPGSGLFKSTDGGDTWTEITRNPGMPAGVIGRIGVVVSPVDSNRVFAIVENENGGVFRSDDAGGTWTKVNDERNLRQRAFYYTHITADTKDKDTVYVLNTGLYRSTDGGKTYASLRGPHGDHHDLWVDPDNAAHLVNGNDGGGTVSFTTGATWSDEDFPTAQFYHVATTKDVPYHVCGAQQDNSTACISSAPRGRGDAPFYSVGGGESGYIAPSPSDPNVFYAGSQGALITVFNRETGYLRDVQVYPRFFSGEPSSALKERWQWTFPIVFSPTDPNVLYTCSQHVWRTTNGGLSWERISPDLTRADPKTLGDSGGPITHDMNGPEIYATVFALAPSRLEKDTIWAGSDDGLVHVTRDGGKNWTNVTPKDLPAFARISIIDASPHKPGTAYFAAKRYLQDDRAPYIYRTDDYGQTWTKIVDGIRPGDYVHAVREDTVRAGLLYAGTEHGPYVSFDNGAHWQSLALNLPDTQISDMVVEKNDLVIATHGRSFYILDDIGPLRQAPADLTTSGFTLFSPHEVTRSVDQAVVYYWLKQPAQNVAIDILDAKGQVVRSYKASRAEEQKKKSGAADDEDGGFRRGPRQPPLTNAGLTKFTWDLRYTGATTFDGMILWSGTTNGPTAVPGTYQVRVTADGQTATKSFDVRRNPLYTNVTDADLQEQFDLAVKIRDKVSAANDAVIRIRDVKTQMADRLKKAGASNTALTRAADTAREHLSAIEEEIYQVRNRSGQDPLNFPIKLNNRLASLLRSVMTGDGKPTAASYTVFDELSKELDVQLARLQTAMTEDVGALNKALTQAKLQPIEVSGLKP